MSDIPQQSINPLDNPDEFKHFAFIVDGEVGHISRIQNAQYTERSIACLSSNPTIVEITGDLRTQVMTVGWMYDGETFHQVTNE